ncbi:MAG: ECF transporter S component [Oscillospiraceae bacterium]|nr:ECF transporter S component [Oscillospiraceae bacterium]
MKITDTKTKKLALAALLLAIGMVLPFLTGQIKEIGDTLLPMHLPVMLCGLLCGGWYGLAVGAMLPFFRSICFGMPQFPAVIWMSAELAAYGAVTGLLYKRFFKKQLWWLYSSLLIAMVAGRVVWGVTKWALLAARGGAFTLQAFFVGGFADAVPGIVLQLVLVPVIVRGFEKWGNKGL